MFEQNHHFLLYLIRTEFDMKKSTNIAVNRSKGNKPYWTFAWYVWKCCDPILSLIPNSKIFYQCQFFPKIVCSSYVHKTARYNRHEIKKNVLLFSVNARFSWFKKATAQIGYRWSLELGMLSIGRQYQSLNPGENYPSYVSGAADLDVSLFWVTTLKMKKYLWLRVNPSFLHFFKT